MKFTGGVAILPFFLSLFFLETKTKSNESSCPDERFSTCKTLLRRGAWFGFAMTFALCVFFVLNPPLWFSPVQGFHEFVTLNTNRQGFNIAILFFGKMHNLEHPLPWYNTILWTLITVPLGFLFLMAFAAYRFFCVTKHNDCVSSCKYRRFLLLLLVHPLTLLVVRSVPGTPPHDGVRLFVTAFPFLAVLAALGAHQLSRTRFVPLRPGVMIVVLVYSFGLFNMFWYAPQWLSYYNAVLGGLPGAARAGMEPTYYWDSLDKEVADWLAEHVKENELVLFCPASSVKSLALQKRWGELRCEYLPRGGRLEKGQTLRYYILQRRPSGEYPTDRLLLRNARPVYVKYVRHGGYGIWKLDETPLLEIYDFKDYLRVLQADRLRRAQTEQSKPRP